MSMFIAIIGSLFAFFIVVVVHEWGHFIVARALGIKVLRFSIGFGKPIFSHRAKSGVEYVVGWLPLGGYVKMQDAESLEQEGSTGILFEKKSVWARMAVVVAGPIMNLLLAVFIFTIVYTIGFSPMKPIIGQVAPHTTASRADLKPGDQILQMGSVKILDWQHVVMTLITHIGDQKKMSVWMLSKKSKVPKIRYLNLAHWKLNPLKPDMLGSLGITPFFPSVPPIIFSIIADSPAAKSNLQVNDLIIAINQQKINSWQTLVAWIEKNPNKTAVLTVLRNHHVEKINIKIGEHKSQGQAMGFLGIKPKPVKIPDSLKIKQQYPWTEAIVPATEETAQWLGFHFSVIKQMILGRISLKTLGGPVSIFETAGSASLAGLTALLQFMGFMSVALGVLNILPVPALDGGYLLFFIIEAACGRPLSQRWQALLINLGMLLLVMLILYATTNDILRLLN